RQMPAGLDMFDTYMKLYAQLTPGEHWWWFTSHWNLIVPGKIPVTAVGHDTLIRRRVTLDDKARHVVVGWEGIVFWGVKTGQLIDRMINPATNREVIPFHSKEGPTRSVISRDGIFTGIGTENERRLPLDPPTYTAGDNIWMKREFRFDVPHPLDIKVWKQELVTDRYWANMEMVYRATIAEAADPKVTMARSDMMISGETICVPWLLMGGTGAMSNWSGFGKKLVSPDELPADRLAWFKDRHAELFAAADPWPTYTNPFISYGQTRTPVK
ncbi:MAG: DUF1838 domain-containing protein, partial [Alphaproteobacteria bacterium]|nr:DUF1838 domain-containing protein [Alphaproteobacteria bacterium]